MITARELDAIREVVRETVREELARRTNSGRTSASQVAHASDEGDPACEKAPDSMDRTSIERAASGEPESSPPMESKLLRRLRQKQLLRQTSTKRNLTRTGTR